MIPASTIDRSYFVKHRIKIAIFWFILFTIVSMVIGITVICLTSSNNSEIQCEITFQQSIEPIYTYDSQAQHLATGDFNRDSYSDLVIANTHVHNIGIRFGQNNGSFSEETTYSTGSNSYPQWVGVFDVNNDSLLDIIVANYGTNSLSLFFGDGQGYFTNQTRISLNSSRPQSIAIGDLNHDNHSDIAVVNDGTFDLIIFYSLGNGSFEFVNSYFMGFDSQPYSLVIANFNHDNDVDIAVINYGTSELVIFLRKGERTSSISRYSTGHRTQPCSLTIGDFNHDSHIDIAIVFFTTDDISIFLGDGYGQFRNETTIYSNQSSSPCRKSIATGDINQDTQLDLIVSQTNDNVIKVFIGQGNGLFTLETTQSTGINSEPPAFVIDDFTRDNQLDLAVINSRANRLVILSSYAHRATINQTIYSTGIGSHPNCLATGDFNNDNYTDIVVANNIGNNIGIFLNSIDGKFSEQDVLWMEDEGSEPTVVVTGDFNHDNYLDLAVILETFNRIQIYSGVGNGSFEFEHRIDLGDDWDPTAMITADLNNDTYLDLLITSCSKNQIAILFGSINGSFSQKVIYSVMRHSCPIYIATGHFNDDQFLDFVTANYVSSTLSIFFNDGNSLLQKQSILSVDNLGPYHLAIGDLNDDGREDIVFTVLDSFVLGILFNIDNEKFTGVQRIPIDSQILSGSIVLGYFNVDTKLDIVVTNPEKNSVTVFIGDDQTMFTNQYTIELEDISDPFSIVKGDFNHDDRDDVAIANLGTDDISILINGYETSFRQEDIYNQQASLRPTSIIIGDLNNDKQLDLVLTSTAYDTVGIFTDFQDGRFTKVRTFETGRDSYPRNAAIGDFNHDEYLDLAVINSWADTLMILLNPLNETLSFEYSIGSNSSPNSIVTGDLNNDSWTDIIIANYDTNNIGIFLGYDYPTFVNENRIFSSRGACPCYLAVADLNNDSNSDMILVQSQADVLDVYLGSGDGTFTLLSEAFGLDVNFSEPTIIALADFNNDKYVDFAILNVETLTIGIFLGEGTGAFDEAMSLSIDATSAISIAIGDFNGDNQQDVAFISQRNGKVGIFLGYGNGSFTDQVTYWVTSGFLPYPVDIQVGDFNNDNISDIVVANILMNNIGILLSQPNGTFQNMIFYATGLLFGPSVLATGDLNQDSSIDIIVANRFSRNIAIFFGNGNGTFSSSPLTYTTGTKSYVTSITIADMNNDTIQDIVLTDTASDQVSIFFGLGNGSFLHWKGYSTNVNSDPNALAVADFDNDGRIDFAVCNSNKDQVLIYLRYQNEPFGNEITISTGSNSAPFAITINDFNRNDRLDLAVTNTKTNTIQIFLDFDSQTFSKQTSYSTGLDSFPTDITSADLDHDQNIDIAFINSNSNELCILFGYGNGSFSQLIVYSTGFGSLPGSLTIADLNQDNQLDIAIVNTGIDSLLIFYGFGNRTFQTPRSYSFDYNAKPIAILAGDINNDIKLDLIVANYGLGYIDILLRMCSIDIFT